MYEEVALGDINVWHRLLSFPANGPLLLSRGPWSDGCAAAVPVLIYSMMFETLLSSKAVQSHPLCLLGGLSELERPLLRGHPSPALWSSMDDPENGQPLLEPEEKSLRESLFRPRLVLLLPAYEAESDEVVVLTLCPSKEYGFSFDVLVWPWV